MAEVQTPVIARPMQDGSVAARKKFATPPVKIACLAWYVSPALYSDSYASSTPKSACALDLIPRVLTSCSRASRTRCTGETPCASVCRTHIASTLFVSDSRSVKVETANVSISPADAAVRVYARDRGPWKKIMSPPQVNRSRLRPCPPTVSGRLTSSFMQRP